MRIKYWRTSSRDVTRPSSIAVRIPEIVASTTVNGVREAAGPGVFLVCAPSVVNINAARTAAARVTGATRGVVGRACFMDVMISELRPARYSRARHTDGESGAGERRPNRITT